MQSQMMYGEGSSHLGGGTQLPNTLKGTRSMQSFVPHNQLLLKIPKVPTDGAIRPSHPVNNWVQNVGDQISNYKSN